MHAEAGLEDDGGALLLTRLRPPLVRAGTLQRGDLLQRLDAMAHCRVVLVTGAAGYGKTVLLTQWHEQCSARGRRAAWLSADDEDLSPGRLVAYLAHAFARAGLDAGPGFVQADHADGAGARQRLRQLLNAIARHGEPVVLIIDDADRLGEAELRDVLAPLLRWAPDNLLLALGGRLRPDIPIAALRVQGLVGEIGAAELQFGLHDIVEIFGTGLSRQDATAILAHSLGWPAIVQLLHGVWRQVADRDALIASFDAVRGMAGDYLSEQILDAVPPAIRDLLIALSPLDIIGEEAAAFVHPAGAALWHALMRLDGFDAFLIRDGVAGGWRLHPILRQLLRDGFDARPPAEQWQAHARLADWHDRAGHLIRSVRHARLAGDAERVARYIFAAGATRIWIRQGKARLEAIDGLLDDALLQTAPRLKLLRALVLIKRGELGEAERLFRAAHDGLAGCADADVQFDLLLVESTLLFNQCKPSGDEYLSIYARRMEEVGDADDMVLGNVKTLMSLSCQQRGHPERADRHASDAQVHYARAALPHGSFFVELHRAAAQFAMGNSAAADVSFDRAQALARRHFPDDGDKPLLVAIGRAEIACDAGRFGLAEKRLQGVLRRLPAMEGWHAVHAIVHGVGAAIAMAEGGVDAALDRLAAAERICDARGLTGLHPFLTAQRMACLARAGRAEEAAEIAEVTDLSPAAYLKDDAGEMLWREREAVLVAFAGLALARGEPDRVAGLIEQPLRDFARMKLSRPRIHLHLLGAIARERMGDAAAADHHLFEAMSLAGQSGHVRAFLEEGDALAALLGAHIGRAADSGMAAHLLSLLTPAEAPEAAPLLTPREGDVLSQLRNGLSAKRIARSLDLTENTVKFHLKNIYGKLGVNSRTQAIVQAQALFQPIENTLQ
ncbi:LuxR C-terminal-related transcriptional regulator [Sphingomonas colocasiae]|uniref:LuxR C-terminal-related transcriptional regulator n=1 Tax=Sphingomonas colocasiae TaxID=1848973 RepID=A0ABS7PX10_9SPHN|nr:LuxR C-terminal-related transcriptional regulator [Sphingomonas colocasiae]MBY8825753.1 LuxR C-terminal-related transcriptional regulator [Sphingomonas colocasiae]